MTTKKIAGVACFWIGVGTVLCCRVVQVVAYSHLTESQAARQFWPAWLVAALAITIGVFILATEEV